MTTTNFQSVAPPSLIEGVRPTPFAQRATRGLRRSVLLEDIDYLTDFMDAALAEAEDETPVSVAVNWLPANQTPFSISHDTVEASERTRRERALATVDLTCDLLAVSVSAAADVLGVTRNTIRSWRNGDRVPYPKTLRRLLEVDSILSAALAVFGPDGARTWFAEPSGDRTRGELLANPGGAAHLADELRKLIFADRNPRTISNVDDFDPTSVEVGVYRPGVFGDDEPFEIS